MEIHVLALLGGGGLAIAHDRATLRAYANADEAYRAHHLRELAAVHRWVGTALTLSILSGAALFFLNVERFVGSAVFWVKVALVVGLAANALVMQIAERDLRESPSDSPAATGWRRLRGTALASSTLWTMVVLAGVVIGQRR